MLASRQSSGAFSVPSPRGITGNSTGLQRVPLGAGVYAPRCIGLRSTLHRLTLHVAWNPPSRAFVFHHFPKGAQKQGENFDDAHETPASLRPKSLFVNIFQGKERATRM